jgi:REP element-mobilizing transposase RayT
MNRGQFNLFSAVRNGASFGGALRAGQRKTARPLATKKPLHLVLRSSRAVGEWSFLRAKNRTQIDSILENSAKRYGIRVIGFENVGNHLHLLIQGKNRALLQAFLRTLPAKIALAITQAKRGNRVGRFFDQLVFTRVVEWGRDFLRTKRYFWKNKLEACGVPAESVDRWRVFAKALPF